MSKSNLVRCAVLSMAMIAVSGLNRPIAVAADADPVVTGMETFTAPDGVGSFALTMKLAAGAPAAGPRDVLILFNTSAAQNGEYRAKGLETLKATLAALPNNDRVQLMAVDLNAAAITKEFVAPESKEMGDALAALEARAPLGATDMEKSLNAAADVFGESKNPRAIIYIGDGRSAANLLAVEGFGKLTQKLVAAKVPVTSYVIGARVDRQLPGALAAQTGGAVVLDTDTLTGAEAGRQLAAAANATVVWPTAVTWPAEMTQVLPKQLPPLRGDRETVAIGSFKGKGPFKVEVTAEGQKLGFTATPGASDDSNSYLAQLVERAKVDGGITLPLVGAASLADARQTIGAGVRDLAKLAQEALAANNLTSAEQIVTEALRLDPNDTNAQAIKGAIEKRKAGGAPAAAAAAPAAAGAGAAAPAAGDAPAAGGASDLTLVGPGDGGVPPGALAEGFQRDRRLIAQVIQAEVQNAVGQARSMMSADPDLALQQLKLTLEKVRQTAELNPDVRDQLVNVLQTALREAARRKVEVEHARQERLANMAAAKERVLIADNLARNQEKTKQLMSRFDSLMREGRYRPAEEAAAAEAQKLQPGNPVPAQAALEARTVGYYENIMVTRLARQKGVVDTLYQTEKSLVPFPDDPPIVYVDSEVWRQLTDRRTKRYSSMDLAQQRPAEKKIHDALKSPTNLEFVETPLSDVIDYLKEYHGIEIQLDNSALTDVGIGSDTAVTKNLKGITLKSALKLMLRELKLTYVIQDEVLLITTPEEAESRLSTKVYPVADLVIPIQTPAISGLGGMGGSMGGMGSSMGGMGGMGGGMGGMGGGMGGMGGGMGMFNVQDLLKKAQAGGFQAFSVKDDVDAKDAKPAAAAPAKIEAPAKVEAPATIDNRPAKISVEIEKGANPDKVWEEYFSKNEPRPAAVRDAVRRLKDEQKFDHVIALINAALRHRQAQPWMYEALSLAMEAAGRPKADIERAVMSAVDFVDNTNDLMFIGAYLVHLGLDERALQVYRQAASIEPLRPEPYMLGLKAARKLNDLESLKWVSLGILSQAWPKDQADVWSAGVGVAKEVLDKLKAEKRTKEADAFLAALDQAVVRDCVAVVTWTGEADLDIMIEEPSGSVCSLRNQRTSGGGVLLGDALTQTGRDSYGGHSEVYVCPKGFDGTYRMLVRRVWGNITTGKVNVEVMTHFRGPNSVDVRKKVSLDKDEALVVFDLKNGRRKEPIRDQQLANAIGGQLAVNQQILGQQLESSVDPSVMQAIARSRALGGYNSNGGNGGSNVNPFFSHGAVGYQPVIITLPEGANLIATAVISADRRYVRVTSAPIFSGVSEVNTFNTATGDNKTGQGGTGGQGYSSLFGSSGGGSGGSGMGSICFGGLFRNVQDVPGALFPYRDQRGAVVVTAVQPGAPGDKAGLRVGDIIFRFDGQSLPVGDTIMLLREKVIPLKLRGNETRTISILREGVELELKVFWPNWHWEENPAEIRDLPETKLDKAA